MELELNEKIWYGKYKGMRIYEIIDNYPKQVIKMIREEDLKLSKESNDFLVQRLNRKSKTPFSSWLSDDNIVDDDFEP